LRTKGFLLQRILILIMLFEGWYWSVNLTQALEALVSHRWRNSEVTIIPGFFKDWDWRIKDVCFRRANKLAVFRLREKFFQYWILNSCKLIDSSLIFLWRIWIVLGDFFYILSECFKIILIEPNAIFKCLFIVIKSILIFLKISSNYR
jgi:hypothetical protein